MIQNPLLLCLTFVGLVAALRKLSTHPALRGCFRVLPVPFWCYFLPTLGSTLGLLPQSHALYDFLSQQLLPVCLILLLLGTNLRGLARMGPLAAFLMLAGSAGTILGGLASFSLYRRWLPAEAWGGIGALTGSWIGGSANLLAVKEALRVPDPVIAPVILVDAAIAYGWMGLLLWSSALAPRWTRWIGASTVRADPEQSRRIEARMAPAHPSRAAARASGIAISVGLSLSAQRAAQAMPAIGAAVNASTWTILLVTTAAVALSLTPLRRLGEAGFSGAGTFALYVLLGSILHDDCEHLLPVRKTDVVGDLLRAHRLQRPQAAAGARKPPGGKGLEENDGTPFLSPNPEEDCGPTSRITSRKPASHTRWSGRTSKSWRTPTRELKGARRGLACPGCPSAGRSGETLRRRLSREGTEADRRRGPGAPLADVLGPALER